MTTNVNIVLQDEQLVKNVQVQQIVARLAQANKENDKNLNNSIQRLRADSGNNRQPPPNGGGPSGLLDYPAAFRQPSGATIGLSWFTEGSEQYYYGTTYDGYLPNGESSKFINTRFSGYWNSFNVAFSGPDDTYSSNEKTPIQIGCGNGSAWLTFEFGLSGMDYSAVSGGFTDLLVQDDYRPLVGGGTALFGTMTISECTQAHNENTNLSYDWLALPAGKDNHIIIFHGVATYSYVEVTGLFYHFERTSNQAFIWPDGPPWYLNGSNFYPNGFWYYNQYNNSYFWNFYPPEYRVEYWGPTAYSYAGWAKPYSFNSPPLAQFGAFGRGIKSAVSRYGRQKTTKAFVVSNTAIREIAVPGTVQEWIDVVTDEATNSQTIEEVTKIRSRMNSIEGPFNDGYPHTQTLYPSQYVQLGFYYGNGNGEGIEPYYQEPFTPAVYAMMNNEHQFTDPANIKSFPPGQKYILEDWNTEGTFKLMNSNNWCYPYSEISTGYIYEDYYVQGASFSYAYWNATAEYPYPDYSYGDSDCWGGPNNPYPAVTSIKPAIEISPSATPRTGIPYYLEAFGYKQYISDYFIVVNDWNDPAYCKQMLLALGFSAADLKP